MKKLCKSIALLLTAFILSSAFEAFAETGNSAKKTDSSVGDYNSYLNDVARNFRSGGDAVCEINAAVGNAPVQVSANFEQDGEYIFGIIYKGASHRKKQIAVSVEIDGVNISEGNKAIELDKLYCDIGGVRTDGKGNEFTPEQGLFENSALVFPLDGEGYTQYSVSVSKGNHSVSIASLNDSLYIDSVIFKLKKGDNGYNAPAEKSKYYTGNPIICEGENSLWKNSSWLVSQSDNSSYNVTPEDPVLNRVNYIGGSNWKQVGETITWQISVPSSGYYKLAFSYRQSLVVNYSSYRKLMIDGLCPFEEVENISFPYGHSWDNLILSDESGEPYLFYLSEGYHTLSLQVSLGDYKEICKRLEAVVKELSDNNLKMTMITGETVDINRDYDLFKYIPDLEESFTRNYSELKAIETEINRLSGGESSSYALVLRNMAHVIQQMLNNKYSAARYKSDFYTNYSSLSVSLSDMQTMPLDIDRLILGAPEDSTGFSSEKGIEAFFKSLSFSVKRFINTFAGDYDSVSDKSGKNSKLTLWVNWSQDQARVLNSMIKTDFTTATGISVEVQVVNATIIQAIVSGNGPDVVLQRARTEPVNLAMRGALYDLTNFADYEGVLKRFTDDAAKPYYYNGGLYALPDTQTFNVLFYRKDILSELGIKIPQTWEEFAGATETLLHNNLSAYLPYTQITSSATVNTGVGGLTIYPTLLLQNGIELYSEDGKRTNLSSPEALNVFESWTEYYTNLKLPTEMNFYNRFRAGTTPLGITTYSTAVTITSEAPELEGLWGMAPVPGTDDGNGNIDHTSAGGGTGCSILNISKNKEGAWEFLKWWTSAKTQEGYSANLESILGPLGRVMVSNTEALKALSWNEDELNSILEARNYVKELSEVPGGYQVSRSIDMAFYNVVNSHVNPKSILIEWAKTADKEIQRKWEQYSGKSN